MDGNQILIIIVVVLSVVSVALLLGFVLAFVTFRRAAADNQWRQIRERELDTDVRQRLAEVQPAPPLPEPAKHIEFGIENNNPVMSGDEEKIVWTEGQGSLTSAPRIDFTLSSTPPTTSATSQIRRSESLYKCPICRKTITAHEYEKGNLQQCQQCHSIYHIEECKDYIIGGVCNCGSQDWVIV